MARLAQGTLWQRVPAAGGELNPRSAAIRAFLISSAPVNPYKEASIRARGRDAHTSDLFAAGQGGANLDEDAALPDLPALGSVHPIHWTIGDSTYDPVPGAARAGRSAARFRRESGTDCVSSPNHRTAFDCSKPRMESPRNSSASLCRFRASCVNRGATCSCAQERCVIA